MKTEDIMFNVLRKNPIPINETSGKYKAALTRLVRQGIAVKTAVEYRLSTRTQTRLRLR